MADKSIQVKNSDGKSDLMHFSEQPDYCPHCHNKVSPVLHAGFKIKDKAEVIFQCPNSRCNEIFIGYYKYSFYDGKWNWDFYETSFGSINTKDFSENILATSSSFVEIYNQSMQAEEHGLEQICGIGYRKALEFLIKDYLILREPSNEELIKKKLLGACINDYIDNLNIKHMAQRAAWLGNDETHYSRKWDGRDVKDLKMLIDITLHWIEMEILTEQFRSNMKG